MTDNSLLPSFFASPERSAPETARLRCLRCPRHLSDPEYLPGIESSPPDCVCNTALLRALNLADAGVVQMRLVTC
jgi:hypothetical protein